MRTAKQYEYAIFGSIKSHIVCMNAFDTMESIIVVVIVIVIIILQSIWLRARKPLSHKLNRLQTGKDAKQK